MKNITIKTIRDKQKQNEEIAEKFFSKPKDDIIFEESNEKNKCSKGKFCLRFISLIIFVFFIGGIGGILIDRFALPYLIAKYPKLNEYDFIKQINERTTIIKVTEEIKISQDKAIVNAIEKVSPSIVQIFSADENINKNTYIGSGIILTSNGYIITSANIIKKPVPAVGPETADANKKETAEKKEAALVFKAELDDGKSYDAKIVENDPTSGLAILKIEASNLPVLPLADSDTLKLGERLIIIDDSIAIDIVSKLINDHRPAADQGKDSKPQKRIIIMQDLDDSFGGAAVVNTKGEIIGISEMNNLVIPTNNMNEFIKRVIR